MKFRGNLLGDLAGAPALHQQAEAFAKHIRITLAQYYPDKVPFTPEQIAKYLAIKSGPADAYKSLSYVGNEIRPITAEYWRSGPIDPAVIRMVAAHFKMTDAQAVDAIKRNRYEIKKRYEKGGISWESALAIASLAVAGGFLGAAGIGAGTATTGGAATGGAATGGAATGGAAAGGAAAGGGGLFASGATLPEIIVTGGTISAGAAGAAAAAAIGAGIAATGLPGALAAPSLPPPIAPQGATLLPEISVTAAPASGVPAAIGAAAIPGSAPWLTENVFATEFTGPTVNQTFSDKALEILKKEAIERGIDYAMELAAQWYAEKLQAKMAAQMQRDLEAQLLAAQAEYEKLLQQGATPEQAASQASRSNGKFGVLLALAGIAVLLLLRR
jgi:hypothetical protein